MSQVSNIDPICLFVRKKTQKMFATISGLKILTLDGINQPIPVNFTPIHSKNGGPITENKEQDFSQQFMHQNRLMNKQAIDELQNISQLCGIYSSMRHYQQKLEQIEKYVCRIESLYEQRIEGFDILEYFNKKLYSQKQYFQMTKQNVMIAYQIHSNQQILKKLEFKYNQLIKQFHNNHQRVTLLEHQKQQLQIKFKQLQLQQKRQNLRSIILLNQLTITKEQPFRILINCDYKSIPNLDLSCNKLLRKTQMQLNHTNKLQKKQNNQQWKPIYKDDNLSANKNSFTPIKSSKSYNIKNSSSSKKLENKKCNFTIMTPRKIKFNQNSIYFSQVVLNSKLNQISQSIRVFLIVTLYPNIPYLYRKYSFNSIQYQYLLMSIQVEQRILKNILEEMKKVTLRSHFVNYIKFKQNKQLRTILWQLILKLRFYQNRIIKVLKLEYSQKDENKRNDVFVILVKYFERIYEVKIILDQLIHTEHQLHDFEKYRTLIITTNFELNL